MDAGVRHESRRWIDEHGDYLYRFALVRVYDSTVAEDLVQETFLAALQGTRRESGPTAERRWMVGIIKHKIIDHFRRIAREPVRGEHQSETSSLDEDFLDDGHWKPELAGRRPWPDKPDTLLEQKQFWDVLACCLDTLPPRTAQVFTLREIDDIDSEEVCRLLHLTQTNLGVILHRARKQLRNCLSTRYFGLAEEGVRS
ncbi:MAG: sigma-70 family RNA polymerase sigma factor [Nitrospira sp.]|nr:sigma-70 family RNA polymerase sigma factor [Nitrospira sp.]